MILVTGAAGHLGNNLIRRLLRDGHSVRASLFGDDERVTVNDLDVEIAVGDLTDPAVAAAAVKGCTRVYHCAGRLSAPYSNQREMFCANVLATRSILRAALDAGVEKVVATSSFSTVGGRAIEPASEDDPFNPLDRHLPYAHTKVAGEYECLKAFADGLPIVIATSTAIIGPYDFKPSSLGRALILFAKGRIVASVHGGFSCVSVRDIVEGHILAMERGRPGQRYIFDTEYLNVDQLFMLYSRVTQRPPPRLHVPSGVLLFLARWTDRSIPLAWPDAERLYSEDAARFLLAERRADSSKARRELGFEPTPLLDAVREAYAWFASRGMVDSESGPR
jgi:nucleoside-diphosphate-sugar epimerase